MGRRYPTRDGLLVSPYELGYQRPPEGAWGTTIHHGYWTRARYNEGYRSVFRNLITNTFEMYKWEHNDGKDNLHTDYNPPKPPPEALMIDVVEEYLSEHGAIHCIRENATRSVYEVPVERWEKLKGLYRLVA